MSVENKGDTGTSHGPERGPYLRYPCRDREDIYELYDDVDLTDSSPSLKGKGLLAERLDTASLGTWDLSAGKGIFCHSVP